MFAIYGDRLSTWDGPTFNEDHRRYIQQSASQVVLPPTPLQEAQRIRAQTTYNALTNRNRLEPIDQTKAREATKPPTSANIIGKKVADGLQEARDNILHEEPPKDSVAELQKNTAHLRHNLKMNNLKLIDFYDALRQHFQSEERTQSNAEASGGPKLSAMEAHSGGPLGPQ